MLAAGSHHTEGGRTRDNYQTGFGTALNVRVKCALLDWSPVNGRLFALHLNSFVDFSNSQPSKMFHFSAAFSFVVGFTSVCFRSQVSQ